MTYKVTVVQSDANRNTNIPRTPDCDSIKCNMKTVTGEYKAHTADTTIQALVIERYKEGRNS